MPYPLPTLPSHPDAPTSGPRWDVFCRVIDNHGDLGVCWRLSADLASRGHRVRLWIDDPSALAWMAPDGAIGVQVMSWREPLDDELPGDVVVEAFGCDPPAGFVARMASAVTPPLWLNLEYLSAQSYVERSHGLRSPQMAGPGRGLDKWFYYPGFTPATGGLLRERGIAPPPVQPVIGRAPTITLFSYDPPGLVTWRDALARLPEGARVDVTPGWSMRSVTARLGVIPTHTRDAPTHPGELDWRALPHVPQPAFDAQLRRSDLNLVRGEDSLVRALWAGRPFVWQLYPQDDGAHADKLEAFLGLYLQGADAALADALAPLWRAWNGLADPAEGARSWDRLLPGRVLWPAWQAWAAARSASLAERPDLVTCLLDFVARHQPAGQTV